MKINISRTVATIILASIFSLSTIFFASVSAQEGTIPKGPSDDQIATQGIVFPVAELGNCSSKEECKKYCDQPENMSVCIDFAKAHGLMTEKEAGRAEKFAKQLGDKKGPGECTSPESCERYCSNINHLDECMSFAEKNGLAGDDYKHGQKIRTYLKDGGTMPGGCTSREECQSYCGDFAHAKECFAFAKKAGVLDENMKNSGPGRHEEPTEEQLGKLAELVEKGETPGGCSSKDSCEAYCQADGHLEECTAFGVKAGFMSQDEADRVKSIGGKGPGQCASPKACQTYCNDQAHQEECFAFAQEHGFISKEDAGRAKEGWVRARQGFEDAPPEVRECLKSSMGENILEDIQAGKLIPGADVGEKVRACFEKFGGNARPQEVFKNAPPEVTSCLKEKLGDGFEQIKAGTQKPTPEMADTFRGCFQQAQFERGDFNDERNTRGSKNGTQQQGEQGVGMMRNFLQTAPPEMTECLKEKLGDNFDTIQSGEMMPSADTKDGIRACFEKFNPQQNMKSGQQNFDRGTMKERQQYNDPNKQHPQQGEGGNRGQEMLQEGARGLQNMPPEVLACINEKLGAEEFQKLATGPASGESGAKIRACMEEFKQTQQKRMEEKYQLQQQGTFENKDGSQTLPPQDGTIPQPKGTEPPQNLDQNKDGTSSGPTGFFQHVGNNLASVLLIPLRWFMGK